MKTVNNLTTFDNDFWSALDTLVWDNKIIIDRPKGTAHPKYSNIIYNVDYGYLQNTKSMDDGGIDIYVGSMQEKRVDSVICTVDLLKGDCEIKILYGCSNIEKQTIYQSLNCTANMKGLLINR